MELFNRLLVIFVLFLSVDITAQTKSYATHGASFEANAGHGENWRIYKNMAVNDTVLAQLSGKVVQVCQAKGCWMRVDLDNGEQVFVKFKDYGFFVPKDAVEKNVIMNGAAFVEEVTVAEQRHYAQDEGATGKEIEKIKTPKRTLRFVADGVLIEE